MLANSEMNISSSERVTIDVPGTFRLRRTSNRVHVQHPPVPEPRQRLVNPHRHVPVSPDRRTGLKLKNTRQRCKFETSLVAEALA
jgi:hypothetical protein